MPRAEGERMASDQEIYGEIGGLVRDAVVLMTDQGLSPEWDTRLDAGITPRGCYHPENFALEHELGNWTWISSDNSWAFRITPSADWEFLGVHHRPVRGADGQWSPEEEIWRMSSQHYSDPPRSSSGLDTASPTFALSCVLEIVGPILVGLAEASGADPDVVENRLQERARTILADASFGSTIGSRGGVQAVRA
jgi:hypothetical protein